MKFSVALCTHNGAKYLGHQLRSILSQTKLPSEVIVSDDASSDETIEIVNRIWEEFRDSAPRLVLLQNSTPLGVTKNFEQAVTACSSEIIALCDQDDIWGPSRMESVIAKFAANPHLKLVFSDARLVDETGEPLGLSLFDALEINVKDLRAIRSGKAFSTLLRRNLVTGATTAFRQELLSDAVPFDPLWLHDEWLAMIASATGEIDWMPEQQIDYRQHDSNQIGASAPTFWYKVGRILEPREDRNRVLAERATALLDRMVDLNLGDRIVSLVAQKYAHESLRANLPENRLMRIGRVLREATTGNYERFSSRARLDILRDLLQPAR
ncbi:glycosyltransferase family 2 protein [Homoserinimonas sp. A447]